MPIYQAKPPPLNQTYYVFNHDVSEGPYDLPFIEALVMSALLPSDVSVSKDEGATWKPLPELVPGQKVPLFRAEPALTPPATSDSDTRPNYAGIVVVGFIVLVIISVLIASGSKPTTTYQPAPQATAPTEEPAPLPNLPAIQPPYKPPSAATVAPIAQPVYTSPRPGALEQPAPVATPPAPTYEVSDTSGRTFQVSNADYMTLGQKEDALKRLMRAINGLKSNREEQNRLIESERATLDNTDQSSVDAFNTQVDQYNASGTTLDSYIDQYNAGVQDHNEFLLRVGTPVNGN
jgi:hypothetical protein